MKRVLALMMVVAITGCWSSSKKIPDPNGKASPDLVSERKLAEKLPIVTPESVTAQNALLKAREMEDELNRHERRMAAKPSDEEFPRR